MRGYVIGPDYDRVANELEEACAEEGVGAFIHPTKGSFQVVCRNCTRRETFTRRTGIASFSLTFERSAELGVVADAPNELSDALDLSESALEQIQDAADEIRSDITNVRLSITESINDLRQFLAGLDVFTTASTAVADFASDLRSLSNEATSLASSPATASQRVYGAVRQIAATFDDARAAVFALQSVFDYEAPGILGRAFLARARRSGSEYIQNTARAAAFQQTAISGLEANWESLDEANAARETAIEAGESLYGVLGDRYDQVIADTVALMVGTFPRDRESLPVIDTVRVSGVTNSIVLAHEVNGNLDRELEIPLRNRAVVGNPCFLPVDTDLEVRVG